MPLYDFRNSETGEISTVLLKISELNHYKESNPQMTQVVGAPGLVSGQTLSGGKLPEGFKDRLREMQKQNPTANGIKHLL